DGRFLLYSEAFSKTKQDLWVLPLDGNSKPQVYLNSEFNETEGQFSPDGKWVAYVSDETGKPEVYVQPFPAAAGGGGKLAVSSAGGIMPRWSKDGKELFFWANARDLMVVDVTYNPSFKFSVARSVFQLSASVKFANSNTFMWDIARDGKFLITTPEAHD